jgi:hypothetical protein
MNDMVLMQKGFPAHRLPFARLTATFCTADGYFLHG